jgi:hypothetical protein
MTATTTDYVIRETRNFYGPSSERSVVMAQSGQRAMTFADPAEARAYVAELERSTYYLAHNESSRPEYKVMRADRLPEYLTWSL